MKKLVFPIAVLLAAVSCNDRAPVVRDTIPYVKQLAVDTAGTFSLVRHYRTDGAKGAIALIGEPEECMLLSRAFLTADKVDNIDGKAAPDRLPDFAGETFTVLMDDYNAPYLRLVSTSRDTLREVAVRNAVMALDTAAYSNASDRSTRLRKNGAKVFVLASSLLSGYGRFDIDTLFKMAGREALVLSSEEALVGSAVRSGARHVAVWAPAEARSAYLQAAAGGLDLTVITPEGDDVRTAFRNLLRQYRQLKPNTVLDAVLLDSFTADTDELAAEVEHIHRQITEEDMSFDSTLAVGFRFLEPTSCLTDACYRLLREKNLFTHNIAYPSARYYQTEESMDGDYVPVEVSLDYLAKRFGGLNAPAVPREDSYIYVPDYD